MSKFKKELVIVIIISALVGIRVAYLQEEKERHLEQCEEIVYKRSIMRNVMYNYKSCKHY